MRLDAKTVSQVSLPSDKSDHIAWDGELRGFGYRLRRGAGGQVLKTWVVQ